MSHSSRILQAMKPGCVYRPVDLSHLGIDPGTVATLLKALHQGGVVELIEDDGYRRKKMYKTKQKDLFDAPSQALIDGCKS